MKNVLTVLGVLGLGVAVGRLFDGAAPRAEAGGGNPLPACQDINGDGSSDISDAVFLLQWQFLGGREPTCPTGDGQPLGLPDTGQNQCYDEAGNELTRGQCFRANCQGQDGPTPTGCQVLGGRFADNGDGTVTDRCTGLMWQKDTADVHADGRFTDQDSVSWCDALAYCENLSFARHDDWRLPNVRELQSLVDYGRFSGTSDIPNRDPAIDPGFSVQRDTYWASTTVAFLPDRAWLVAFDTGRVAYFEKNRVAYVLAVRSAP
jgi:hypothetical protein